MLSTLHTPRFGTALPNSFENAAKNMERAFGYDNGFRPKSPSAPVSLWEDDRSVYLEVDVPGVREDDLELTIQDGKLWIRGQRRLPHSDVKCWYDERSFGSFERLIALSDMIDPNSIEASLEDGVLYLTLSKKEEAQPHRIQINGKSGHRQKVVENKEEK